MAQVITLAGERLFALKAQNNEQLDIDTFIFANVPGQDSTTPIDRNEGLPPLAQRVHSQIVQQTGRVNDNVVIYSTVLDSLTGPFDFNWVGLYSSVNQTLVAISHVPPVEKTITEPGAAGNTLSRNFGIEYSGIAELTGITIDPETWQVDHNARLNGMDELTRKLAEDMNGKDWFIGDGFKVVPRSTLNTFKVTAGAGYVSGLRVELTADHFLTLSSYPQFVYVDAWFDGETNSVWKGQTDFTVTNIEKDDYIDANGKQHYVFKLAKINAADNVEDLRSKVGLAEKINMHVNNADSKHDAIYHHSFANVESMVAYEGHVAGLKYSTGGTIWRVNNSGALLLNGGLYATPIGEFYLSDLSDPSIWTKLSAFKHVVIDINISKTGTYGIPEGQVFELANSIITQGDNLKCLSATSKNWQLTGKGKITRAAGIPTAKIIGSIGLYVGLGSVEHNISGSIDITNFAESGATFDGGGVLSGGVSYASTGGLRCWDNWDGIQLLDGFSSEYHSISNTWAKYNVNDGVLLESGNVTWNGGGSVSNGNGGVHLRHPEAGGNPHHGVFVGAQINHNNKHSINADKVSAGHAFIGCNLYDNGNKASGRLTFDNSRNITIQGGILACSVEYIDDGEHPHRGYNMLNDMRVADGVTLTNGARILRKGNYTADGTWALNDKARCKAVKKTNSDLTLSGQTSYNLTSLITTKSYDNRSAINITYGTFVAPYDMTLKCSLDLAMTFSTAITAGAAIILKVDPTGTGSYTTVRSTPLLTMCQPDALKALLSISLEVDVVKGTQVAWLIEGLATNNNVIHGNSQMIFSADY